MATREPATAPSLFRFFDRLVRSSFGDLRMSGETIPRYLAALLTRFARTEQLYAWRDTAGRRLTSVAELLIEAERAWAFDAPDFDPFRERTIRQHIGDYTLFMTGMFGEHVARHASTAFYACEGKRAYQAVADFERAALHPEARLFAALAVDFERYVGVLTYLRRVHLRRAEAPPGMGSVLRMLAEW